MTADELLDALTATLERMRRLVPADKRTWDADPRTALAVERLWIEAGNAAEEYRRMMGVDLAFDPWAELYEYRNRLAHTPIDTWKPGKGWAAS